jgi:ABC-type transporter Mla subunit MlaD
MEQLTNTINAANTAGPVTLLALSVFSLVVAIVLISLKFIPIVKKLVDNNEALASVKEQVLKGNQSVKDDLQESNKFNRANSEAVGGVAETLSQMASSLTEGQNKLGENQLKLSASQETLAKHFDRSVDVLSNIYDRMGAQSTQMDVLISTTGATKRTADDTHSTVAEIKESISNGVIELNKITAILNDIKNRPPEQSSSLTELMNTAIEEIRAVKTTIASIYAMPFDRKELPTEPEKAEVQP